jgi:thiamine-phosphate pyrophosphorylase
MTPAVPEGAGVRLMLVTDRRSLPRASALASLVREAAAAGIDDVQVREKDLPARALLGLVREIGTAVAGTAARVLVNGRPDVAAAAGAAGAQLPEEGLPVGDVRRCFPGLAVGASRHSVAGVVQAEREGAHFVILGPVFATPGKEARALGLDVLAEAARAVRIPVYAIGGVDAGRARDLVTAGARGLALMRPFLAAPPAATVAALRAALS